MSTKIEWCDEVWNPITGCTPVSAGCANCYAMKMANRLRARYGYPEDAPFRVTFHQERLNKPLEWRKPRKIFVCSMGDLFHEMIPDRPRDQIFETIRNAKQHTFLLLTKRPKLMSEYLNSLYEREPVLKNVWIGVTAENQYHANERIPLLLATPAARRFVSVEPMLGHVNLETIPATFGFDGEGAPNLDWVICGGETGQRARSMEIEWVRSLRDQCQQVRIPFFFKQWGEYNAAGIKVGKKHAGSFLDGREWREFPE